VENPDSEKLWTGPAQNAWGTMAHHTYDARTVRERQNKWWHPAKPLLAHSQTILPSVLA